MMEMSATKTILAKMALALGLELAIVEMESCRLLPMNNVTMDQTMDNLAHVVLLHANF